MRSIIRAGEGSRELHYFHTVSGGCDCQYRLPMAACIACFYTTPPLSNMGLDTVELVLSVEKFFGISIPDEAAVQLDTVGKLHAFIVAELGRPDRQNVNPFDELRAVICRQLAVHPHEVVPNARFVQDLGAD